jgi:hypothetical protein
MLETGAEHTHDLIARLSDLYQKDPQQFAKEKTLLIQELIESFPEEHRKRAYGLQFRLDAELSRYKDPVSRMNRMVELFWEGIGRFQDVLNDPATALQERQRKKTTGEIIPLRPHKENLQ